MYTGMSRVISFRTDDEIAEVIDKEVARSDEETSRAAVTKRLVEEAVEARRNPLWLRVGMSNRRAAQLEDLRQQGESEADLARDLLGEALEARGEDVLDAIGASDELREAVEDERADGESLDGAVERLLRLGVDSADLDAYAVRVRLVASLLAYTAVVIAGTVLAGWSTMAIAVALTGVAAVVYSRYRPLSALPSWA